MERREGGAETNGWSGFAGGMLVGGLVATGGVLVAVRYKEYLLPKGLLLLLTGKDDEYGGREEKIVSGASNLQGSSVTKRKGIRWVVLFFFSPDVVDDGINTLDLCVFF